MERAMSLQRVKKEVETRNVSTECEEVLVANSSSRTLGAAASDRASEGAFLPSGEGSPGTLIHPPASSWNQLLSDS